MKRRIRTNKNIPAKGRLRDMADKLWSLAVRADWNNTCAMCGASKCDAHHLIPRQIEATRYELHNGMALCSRCHQFCPERSPHQNAAGFMAWVEEANPLRAAWMKENHRPQCDVTVTPLYLCDVLRDLRQYFEATEFESVCGVRFSHWLRENDS